MKPLDTLKLLERRSIRIVGILIACYIAVFSVLTVCKFLSFSYHDFDLADHLQILWVILHGSAFCSILDLNFLGNHAHFISFLLAPLYALFPSPLLLLLVQTAVLGLSAYPIYLIAGRYLKDQVAVVVTIVYLLYPGLVYTNLFEFHPTPFATLFLSWMLYFYLSSDFRKFLFWAFLSLLVQENIALIVMMMGVMALIERRPWKWVFVPFMAGLIFFLFLVRWLIPHFSNGNIDFFSLYSYIGKDIGQVLINLVTHPDKTFHLLTDPSRLRYLSRLFLPLCLLPVFGAYGLIPILPILAQHMLSNRWTERSMEFHYTAEMLPFLFFGLILGLRHFLRREGRGKILVLALLFFTAMTFMTGPWKKIIDIPLMWGHDYSSSVKNAMIAKIPEGTPVVTTFDFLSHLANRMDLYSFHHVYEGYHTLSSVPFVLPDKVKVALVDFNDPSIFIPTYFPENYPLLTKFVEQGWRVSDVRNSIVMFKKEAGASAYPLYERLASFPEITYHLNIEVARDMVFEGYEREPVSGGILKLRIYWRAIHDIDRDITRIFYVNDASGKLLLTIPVNINYRFYPTIAWKSGEKFRENIYLVIPPDIKDTPGLRIEMGFFNFTSQKALNHGKRIKLWNE